MTRVDISISVDSIRKYFDGEALPEELENALDEAQGPVFSGEEPETKIIITVVP